MRATSEHTLRSQAELAASAAAARVAALEAEAASLRTANQELFRAKSFAEEQRDSAAGWVWRLGFRVCGGFKGARNVRRSSRTAPWGGLVGWGFALYSEATSCDESRLDAGVRWGCWLCTGSKLARVLSLPCLCRSVEMELAALQAQLEREQAAAVERQAEHAGTRSALDATRQQVGVVGRVRGLARW